VILSGKYDGHSLREFYESKKVFLPSLEFISYKKKEHRRSLIQKALWNK